MRLTMQHRLMRSPLFADLDDFSLISRCSKATVRRYGQGDVIDFRSGRYLGVVLDGLVSMGEDLYPEGGVLALKESAAGERGALAIAQRASVVFFLPIDFLLNPCSVCCTAHRTLMANAIRVLAAGQHTLELRQHYLLMKGTRNRLSAYLLDQRTVQRTDTLTLPFNRKHMAEYLSIARPTLSRALAYFRDQGILEFYRETVRIRAPEELSHYRKAPPAYDAALMRGSAMLSTRGLSLPC